MNLYKAIKDRKCYLKESNEKAYAMKNVKIGKLSQSEKEYALNEKRLLYSLKIQI